jgi:hypothetical protein
MMIKKMMLLMALVLAAAACVGPATASAWYDAGVEMTETKTITMTGSFKFAGEIGTVNCTTGVDATAKLFGKSDNSELTSFTVTNPDSANCAVEGGLKTLGCTNLASATATNLPWNIDGNTATDTATITGVDNDEVYTGGVFCPKTLTREGNITMSFDNAKAIKTITLSGTLTATSSAPPSAISISGTLAVTPSGTYGLTR